MNVSSTAFADGSPIPRVHATAHAGGRNISVPLTWSEGPTNTASFAIEVVDVDANLWVHWLVAGIPGEVNGLPEGASGTSMPSGARELDNTFGRRGWGGPQPPSGEHRYRFTVYALDVADPPVSEHVTLDEFREAIEPHVLASASITGTVRH